MFGFLFYDFGNGINNSSMRVVRINDDYVFIIMGVLK
jgi:hypothetical protein